MICLMASLLLRASGESVGEDANGFLACTLRGSAASGHGRPLSGYRKALFSLKFWRSGGSALAAGCRYNGFAHIKRLHANLTGALAGGGHAPHTSRAKLLAFPVDIESHAFVCRRADQPDGQTPIPHNQRLVCFGGVGDFRTRGT